MSTPVWIVTFVKLSTWHFDDLLRDALGKQSW